MKQRPGNYKFTEFQKRVYAVVKKIPKGEVRTYKWVAEKIGKPRAYRAVGQALKKNPKLLIIPCHRIICSDGSLGGYAKGIKVKERLLKKEKAI
ncbi:MAG: MGMT family protein [Candidatus Omnitrophica bacterium]|nr:MGMT family protein [Candidatus Omnitrophota bacterium]